MRGRTVTSPTRASGAHFQPALPAGPSLEARLHDVLRLCRPPARVVGVKLPDVVLAASKADRPLLTTTFARAVDALCVMPTVPLEQLEALADAVRCHVRARRGVRAPDLGTAMRAEERAGVTLNHRQWCGDGPMTPGELTALRQEASAQLRATQDLIDAVDRELARPYAPSSRRLMA